MDKIALVIVPDKIIIKRFLQDYSKKLNSIEALKFPPHLTLVPRFETNKYSELLQKLKQIKLTPFNVDLTKLDFFNKPKIIYLSAKKSPILQKTHETLINICNNYRATKYRHKYIKKKFNPHITLAGSDVDNKKFKEIIKRLPKKQKIQITVKTIYILKKTNKWKLDHKISLLTADCKVER